MKALYISSKPAYPKVDGGCVASANFIDNLLKANIDVEYLTISTNKHPFDLEEFPDSIKDKIQPKTVKVFTAVRPLEAFKYLFKKKSYNIDRFYDERFTELIIERLSAADFDIVVLDSLYATPYLQDIRKYFSGKVFVRTHNVEFKIWEDLAQNERKAVKAKYLNRLAKDLKKYEIATLNQVDGILSLSEDDLAIFKGLAINTKMITIPVTVEVSESEHDYSISTLFHLGAMNWQPNIEAVEYMIEMLPNIRQKIEDMEFRIAGIYAENEFDSSKEEGIVVEGFVEDLNAFIASAGILTTPIKSGSGVRIKILEMMAAGVPVITTNLGAQGLFNLDSVSIADSKKDFVASVYELANDENKRRELGMNAKSYINLHHNPEKVTKQLVEFIESI